MTDIAATILARSDRWMQAWVRQDRAVLEDSLAPDFALIVSANPNQLFDRARWLATCDVYRSSSFAYRDVQVRELAPGFAVMSAIADFKAELSGVDRSGSFFLTDAWRLESDGAWRVCARYSSHPEPAGASAPAPPRRSARNRARGCPPARHNPDRPTPASSGSSGLR